MAGGCSTTVLRPSSLRKVWRSADCNNSGRVSFFPRIFHLGCYREDQQRRFSDCVIRSTLRQTKVNRHKLIRYRTRWGGFNSNERQNHFRRSARPKLKCLKFESMKSACSRVVDVWLVTRLEGDWRDSSEIFLTCSLICDLNPSTWDLLGTWGKWLAHNSGLLMWIEQTLSSTAIITSRLCSL